MSNAALLVQKSPPAAAAGCCRTTPSLCKFATPRMLPHFSPTRACSLTVARNFSAPHAPPRPLTFRGRRRRPGRHGRPHWSPIFLPHGPCNRFHGSHSLGRLLRRSAKPYSAAPSLPDLRAAQADRSRTEIEPRRHREGASEAEESAAASAAASKRPTPAAMVATGWRAKKQKTV
jgi:hypothetical protein